MGTREWLTHRVPCGGHSCSLASKEITHICINNSRTLQDVVQTGGDVAEKGEEVLFCYRALMHPHPPPSPNAP
jgi:hypothetical protein